MACGSCLLPDPLKKLEMGLGESGASGLFSSWLPAPTAVSLPAANGVAGAARNGSLEGGPSGPAARAGGAWAVRDPEPSSSSPGAAAHEPAHEYRNM